MSEKARANKEVASQKKYQESVKATAPPKPSYTTNDGKKVDVRTNSKNVEYIRNQPSSRLTPEYRERNINIHVTNFGYAHPYSYYCGQPAFYVGGGYSSVFWWMMMDWSAERRAMWLYNHQHEIDRSAYERGMRDAQVSQQVAQLQARNFQPDPDYVDPEFKDDPSMQYDQHFVEAAYNPTVVETHSSTSVLAIIGGGVIVFLVAVGIYVLVFKVRWDV
jgi:hypothetical protein